MSFRDMTACTDNNEKKKQIKKKCSYEIQTKHNFGIVTNKTYSICQI